VTYDLFSPEGVWIDESAVVRYYIDHKYEIPGVVIRYLQRDRRLEIPDLEKAQEGKFSHYPDEVTPNSPYYNELEIEKKLRLESYSPFFSHTKMYAFPSNCDEWIDQILPEVKKFSQADQRVLELAILSARRVNSEVWLKNDGDLVARNIKVYISAISNLASGGKRSILSISSLRPGPAPVIEDYRAVFTMPVLEAKHGNPVWVITREAPIFHGNIVVDYDTEHVVNFRRMAAIYIILLAFCCVILMVFTLQSKDRVGMSPMFRPRRSRFINRLTSRHRYT
jgi:hypothetical protein